MEQHWILLSLEKYWSKQAKLLDFQSFVFQYVESMIIKNRETGLEFWRFVRKNEKDTLLEVYKKWHLLS